MKNRRGNGQVRLEIHRLRMMILSHTRETGIHGESLAFGTDEVGKADVDGSGSARDDMLVVSRSN